METRSERYKRQKRERKQRRHRRIFDLLLIPLVFISLLGCHHLESFASEKKAQEKIENEKKQAVSSAKAAPLAIQSSNSSAVSSSIQKKPTVMRVPINWQEPSENLPYPDISKVKNFWIKVSLKKNRTYLMSGKKVIYTMYSSGGTYHRNKKGKEVSSTPTGTFHIESERGYEFYNGELGEGARYWLSWKDHGLYLFHSVPIDSNGQYEVNEAEKLGKEPASHGCIRLSVPDAKWMMENLKTGTKVVIVNN